MLRMIAALVLAAGLLAPPAAAYTCRTHTYFLPDGRMMTCSVCCYTGGCTHTCF